MLPETEQIDFPRFYFWELTQVFGADILSQKRELIPAFGDFLVNFNAMAIINVLIIVGQLDSPMSFTFHEVGFWGHLSVGCNLQTLCVRILNL